jgi:FixJ family two-component response regulator
LALAKVPLISIVDDDRAVREATMSLVRSIGYDVSTFASAEEFLESEQLHDTSCLITDLHMPGLNGIELQDRLIAEGYSVPIVFITAFPDERVRAKVLKAGAICFLSKPYSDERLIGCLDRALKSAGGNANR